MDRKTLDFIKKRYTGKTFQINDEGFIKIEQIEAIPEQAYNLSMRSIVKGKRNELFAILISVQANEKKSNISHGYGSCLSKIMTHFKKYYSLIPYISESPTYFRFITATE